MPSEIKTELASDGFRLFLKSVAAGEFVRYSVLAAGKMLTDTIPYAPSDAGQFIYTGAPPEGVTIHGIAAGSESELPGQTTIRDAGPGGGALAGPWTGAGGRIGGLGSNYGYGSASNRSSLSSSSTNPAAY